MTEGWGMVVAAAIALFGVFGGLFIGRWQLRDQAQVEHGQWLRGQRQEAFVELLAVWDDVIPKLADRVNSPDDFEYLDQRDLLRDALDSLVETAENDRLPLLRAAERVQMLGPESVDRAVAAMLSSADKLASGLEAQFRQSPDEPLTLALYREALEEAPGRREAFLVVAREALRRAPDAKRS